MANRTLTNLHNQKHAALIEHALNALQQTTGLIGNMVAIQNDTHQGHVRADAAIELQVAGGIHQYLVEIKHVDRFATIGQIKNQLNRFPRKGLLIANRITAEAAEKCRELDVQFIDAMGNAYLYGPGWFVLIRGQRHTAKTNMDFMMEEAPRAGTTTAIKTIFALLCQPRLLNAPYREIKQAACVALGTIGWVLFDLNKRGLTTGGKKKGDRRVLERNRLITEWVTNYPIRLRPKLHAKRFHATTPNWWDQTDITCYDAQWGGEVAADKLTGDLKPNTVTIYMRPGQMRENLTKLVADKKLRKDPGGEIEVLETFWGFEANEHPDTVPPLLVYADLLATLDPRNFNVGQTILKKHLHDTETNT